MEPRIFIHPSALVDSRAKIGMGTSIWVAAQIRENAQIGCNCNIGKDVYIDKNVVIGDRCKIQNGVSLYDGLRVDDDVFIGPNAAFTNDKYPRAFNSEWRVIQTIIRQGASIGSNATILCGVTINEYAMIAAGSVVTSDVPRFSLVKGNPARVVGLVNIDGTPIRSKSD